jgi:hypothetical protein
MVKFEPLLYKHVQQHKDKASAPGSTPMTPKPLFLAPIIPAAPTAINQPIKQAMITSK